MANELEKCLCEILTDENGNTITPTCGIENLLSKLVSTVSSLSSGGDITEIDGGYPDNE